MSGRRVVVTQRFFDDGAIAYLNANGCDVEIADLPPGVADGGLDHDALVAMLQGAAGWIVGHARVTRDLMTALPALKVISRRGVGYERVDLEAARDLGRVVCIAAGGNEATVADHTIALMLAVGHRFRETQERMIAGDFTILTGNDLFEKTVGIVGMGRIGRSLARRLQGFDCRILAATRAGLPDGTPPGVERVDLDTLVRESDYISIHAPLTDETRFLFDAARIARMKPTAYLINTARGGLVDDRALLDALRSGVIAGAGLDVYLSESDPTMQEVTDALIRLPNVIATPHSGASTHEGLARTNMVAARSVVAVLDGGDPGPNASWQMAVAADPVSPEALLRTLFDAAVASAQPDRCVPPALPEPPTGRTVVIGAGKAAAAMARAVERHWSGPLTGLVITRHGHGVPCERILVREARHPVPDASGIDATCEMVGLLDGLTADDLVLCLISGGGSALLAAPSAGVSLADLQSLSRRLLRSGAAIGQINCVRKHLSMVAGGRLTGHARPARLVTLAISDVPGDEPAMIASGPTVPDPTTRAEAQAVPAQFGIEPSPAIRDWLNSPASETPKPGAVPDAEFRLIASPGLALEAAAQAVRAAGIVPRLLGSDLEGEARDLGHAHAHLALDVQRAGGPPCVLLSGGETSVTVRGTGRGGRNGEYLLALTHALDGAPGIHALAADTDGIDGTEANAGAISGPGTIGAAGRSCAEALANSDSYPFFEAADALVVTGPTSTNVNDFRAILVDAPGGKGDFST